jgi:hypothetical protein
MILSIALRLASLSTDALERRESARTWPTTGIVDDPGMARARRPHDSPLADSDDRAPL